MGELLSKSEKFGFLLQPKANQTNTPPVGGGSDTIMWENVATIQPTWTINGITGTIVFNPNTNVEQLGYNSGSSIFQEQNRTLINNAGSMPTIDFECYATPVVTAGFLTLALQAFAQSITPGWQKTITPADAVLDMRGNSEGYLASIHQFTITGDANNLHNAIMNNITLTILNNGVGEARLGRLSGQFMSAVGLTGGATASGYTAPETYTFNEGNVANDAFTLDLNIGALALPDFCWRQITISITNNIFSDCLSENAPNNIKRATPEITVQLDIPKTSTTPGVVESLQDGDLITLELYNGYADTVPNHFKFEIEAGFITDTPQATEGDYQSWSIPIMVKRPTAGWVNPVFTIADATEWLGLP
jgi:hypothetical protein